MPHSAGSDAAGLGYAAHLRRSAWPVALIALVGIPMLWSLWAAMLAAVDAQAWRAVWADGQVWSALALGLGSGLAAATASVLLCGWILSHLFAQPPWQRILRLLGPMLAIPHAAFAIGLMFLIAPSGWLLRALSPWGTGFQDPPPWSTSQDPWALGLTAALVAKEVPFLLWAAASHLQRREVGQRLGAELQIARSMGYSAQAAWWRVAWPQLWPRLRWPMLAVLAYSMTVVDVSLIIGPGSPPTLSVLAWTWLLDADADTNAKGAAAALLLALLLVLVIAAAWLAGKLPVWRRHRTNGRRARHHTLARTRVTGHLLTASLAGLYVAVMLSLAVGSVAGVWPFPRMWPETVTWQAWDAVWQSSSTIGTTLLLGLSGAVCALAWCVAWLELAPPAWDTALRRVVYLPLVLPSVLWVVGLHAVTVQLGLDGQFAGLWLAHVLACTPYVLIALSPAYAGFDPRYQHVAASLGKGRVVFLLHVKWPMLRSALASALAVGFAVSVAQYLPTLFVGAGRFNTVTTEAVTLASGGQRSLVSAYAWLQWLLPAAGFALASWAGRPRSFH